MLFGCAVRIGMCAVINLCRPRRMPVAKLLSGTLQSDDIPQALDQLHGGKAMRLVVVFEPRA